MLDTDEAVHLLLNASSRAGPVGGPVVPWSRAVCLRRPRQHGCWPVRQDGGHSLRETPVIIRQREIIDCTGAPISPSIDGLPLVCYDNGRKQNTATSAGTSPSIR